VCVCERERERERERESVSKGDVRAISNFSKLKHLAKHADFYLIYLYVYIYIYIPKGCVHASHLKQLQHAEAPRQIITRSLLFENRSCIRVLTQFRGGNLSFGIIGFRFRELERKILLNNIFYSVRSTIPPIPQVLQEYANLFWDEFNKSSRGALCRREQPKKKKSHRHSQHLTLSY
jgi:hypothetical protein